MHSGHAVAEPVATANVPAAQLVQAVAPAAENVPTAQFEEHTEAPVEGSYRPAGQLVQAVAPAAENWPTAQRPVTAERPVVAQ